jgi:hypothetical protein
MKSELITLVAQLPDNDPRLEAVRRALLGDTSPAREPLLTLGEIGKAVRLGYSQLFRLGVPENAADRTYGGRPRYRLSEVEAYLKSSECQSRREEIRREREQKDRQKKASGRGER